MQSNTRSNTQLNQEELHTFVKGWQKDLENHAEKSETFDTGWNGRIYSIDGTFAYNGIQGTSKVYEENKIVKYLGWYGFKDELIVFIKGTLELATVTTIPKIITEIVVDNFSISSPTNTITGIDFSSHYNTTLTTVFVPVTFDDPNDFNTPVSSVPTSAVIDETYNGLFQSFPFLPSTVCNLNSGIPINNLEYTDGIISFKYDSDGSLIPTILYVGNLNFPFNGKILTEGVFENLYYKRVYFTDYYNNTRVVNIKDTKLASRFPEELSLIAEGTLLNPRIKGINENGQIKAMTVFYVMKLITENGQTTDYSPLSPAVKIVKNSEDQNYSGGDISEITNKSVDIDCYIPNFQFFKQVQLLAIEFEAQNVPTAIRSIGTKLVSEIVSFTHFGSEPEFNENITLNDIFKNSISWKYNSDFAAKNNKLVVVGLRNDPSFVNSKNIAIDFSLNGFSQSGETHDSLLNPDPEFYNYINSDMVESFRYVQRKLFRKFEVFGNFKMRLENTLTGDFYEFDQPIINYTYTDYTDQIADFLLSLLLDSNFITFFPNLNIVMYGKNIMFEPFNGSIETDFNNYNITFTTNQVIIDMDHDIEPRSYSWPITTNDKNNSLVYGGVSNGWFNGNGIRVTMHTPEKELVLNKNTDWMSAGINPLQTVEPTLKKSVMKGEIYRIGIQWFKNGNRLFTTILGDLKIPEIGKVKRELYVDGTKIPYDSNDLYKNWETDETSMYANRLELQFDVRLNCKLSQEVDAYQIVFVERTEDNRTILAQGISAPLERIIHMDEIPNAFFDLPERVDGKWSLPSNGGPVYDSYGLEIYDINPNNIDPSLVGSRSSRIITNRKMFYFDSPDFVYNKISDNFVESSNVEYIETLSTDHARYNIIGGYNRDTSGRIGTQVYNSNNVGTQSSSVMIPFGEPKFSQKIPRSLLAGTDNDRPFNVNVSVFALRLKTRIIPGFQQNVDPNDLYDIDKGQSVRSGEILSAYKMNDSFDISNNALVLSSHGWYFQETARKANNPKYTLFVVNNVASGRDTVVLKTKTNYFSISNIAQNPYKINSKVNFGTSSGRSSLIKGNDAYIISNLKRNNADSIYGGRTEFAYSKNEYIPMTEVFPVIENRISSQVFYAEGDTYCTLYMRNKSTYIDAEIPVEKQFQWSNHANNNDAKYQHNRYGAWCYAVVLESTVEPRLNNSAEFYNFSNNINFNYKELYNTAYLQENNLKKSIPIPFNFKDDPILENIVAVSVVKLNGDFIDAWTQFLVNEFYELDKNKGAALNIMEQDDNIYVVQELQTSQLYIDEKSFIQPDNEGSAIQVNQGDGSSISGHKPISEFGTSNRRAIVPSPFGFVFFDERKFEMVKIIEPLLLTNNLYLSLKQFFEVYKITDIEGYYDDKFKETNLRFRTEQISFVISYNEIMKCFNGQIEYNNDLYMIYQNNVIAPYANSSKLGQLNIGDELNFFEVQKNLRIKVISAPNFSDTKINKGIAILINTNYPIIRSIFETSLGQLRNVAGTHHWYKIREGVHTIPAKNDDDYGDIRGEYCSIDIETECIDNKKISIFSIINYFRKSYK